MLENGKTLGLDSCDDGHNDEVDASDNGDGMGVWSEEERAAGEEERDVGEGKKSNSSFRRAETSDDQGKHCKRRGIEMSA